MSSISQQSAMSRMSRTKMEILSTYLRIQFIIMTLAAKYVHVIEAPQPAQIRPNVTSSLQFPPRSFYLHPREYVVQHAVSTCLHSKENIVENAVIHSCTPGQWKTTTTTLLTLTKERGRNGQTVGALDSGYGAIQIHSLDMVLALCSCRRNPLIT